jgi:hypothetical protein
LQSWQERLIRPVLSQIRHTTIVTPSQPTEARGKK